MTLYLRRFHEVTQTFFITRIITGAHERFCHGAMTGPCDTPRPDFKCRKKVNASSVDTDTLLVRKNANVCGDLTVNGTINNLELQLMRDSGVPPTDEVYNQFSQHPLAQSILENIQYFSVPRDLIVPGTEINPEAPVYGYDVETQELILDGGSELSYNPEFERVDLKYHGQNPAELVLTTPDNMQSWYEHTLSYYLQRGFEMPGSDVYPQYEGQFIYNNKAGGPGDLTPGEFVSIKFYYEDSSVPVALDLAATAAPFPVGLQLFEANQSMHKNGFYYPMRIPITSDFAEFNEKFNKEPIVFYDNLHRRITIHVPDCNNVTTTLFEYQLNIPCCNCNIDIDLTDNLAAFNGTFNLMRRNAQNQLVSSSFSDVEYLIQASPIVSVKTEFIDHGEIAILPYEYYFNQEGGVFTGLAIPLMNGAGPEADVYTFNIGTPNGFSAPEDPEILPALDDNGSILFAVGDNPVTTLIEKYSTPPYNLIFDVIDWNFVMLGLPLPVMEGKTTPEENPLVDMPEFFVTPTRLLNNLIGHEFLHNTQHLQGMISFLTTEGQATALEQDPKLSSAVFVGRSPLEWSFYMSQVTNAGFPLTLPEINASLIKGFPTYGSAIFWYYLTTQFDYNNQVVRRMGDIMSHETFGPLMEENGIPYSIAAYEFGGELGFNPAGPLLALAQALDELHGKDIKDVFSDYAISLAMIRNNTSIPQQYRHAFPYWLASPTYPGYQELSLLNPNSATWWQDYQDNTSAGTCTVSTIPAITDSPFQALLANYSSPLTTPVAGLGAIASPDIFACSPLSPTIPNDVGICVRGGCPFVNKTTNIENAGGIATVVINNQPGLPIIMTGNPTGVGPSVMISQEDGEILLDALEVNPTLTIIVAPAPFISVLNEDVIGRQTEDMTMLIFEIPEDVNTVTVDVTEGDWRISVLQFTSDGTPTGQFIIDGPHANTGGQTVLDITQFPRDPESGSVRLVCANVGIHDYQGLNNWCGAAPIYTGTVSILRS